MNIEKWDPKKFEARENGKTIMIFAKRGSGKTFLCRDLIYNLRDNFDESYCYSRTAKSNDIYPYDFVPENHRFDDYDNEGVKTIYEDLKNKKIEYKKKYPNKIIDKNNKDIKRVLLIFDDIIANDEVRKLKNSAINELAFNGRHYLITCVFITQILNKDAFSPALRKNIDLFICFRCYDESSRKLIINSFLSIKDKKQGEEILNYITNEEDYQALIVETYKSTGIHDYKDFVYKYKASLNIPDFKIGGVPDKDYKEKQIMNNNNANGLILSGFENMNSEPDFGNIYNNEEEEI